jgi:hypothetical protein
MKRMVILIGVVLMALPLGGCGRAGGPGNTIDANEAQIISAQSAMTSLDIRAAYWERVNNETGGTVSWDDAMAVATYTCDEFAKGTGFADVYKHVATMLPTNVGTTIYSATYTGCPKYLTELTDYITGPESANTDGLNWK